MCIAIAKPKNNKSIPDHILRECHKSNPDGMGIAYATGDKLSVYHEMDNVNKLIRKYHKAERKGANIILHFRVATHGEVNETNAHPYWVDPDLVFAHNGTITQPNMPKGRGPGSISDTLLFNREIIRPMYRRNPDFLDDPDVERLISRYIGHSKLVFLFKSGEIRIINQDKGDWDSDYGAWFSNFSYLPVGKGVSCGFGSPASRAADRWRNRAKYSNEKENKEAKKKSRKVIPITEKEDGRSENPSKDPVDKESTTSTGEKNTTSTKDEDEVCVMELPFTDEELAEEMNKERIRQITKQDDPPHHLLCPCEGCETWAHENLSPDWEVELEVDQEEPSKIPLGAWTGDDFYCWADLPRKYFDRLDEIVSVPRGRPSIDSMVYLCKVCGKDLQQEDV